MYIYVLIVQVLITAGANIVLYNEGAVVTKIWVVSQSNSL